MTPDKKHFQLIAAHKSIVNLYDVNTLSGTIGDSFAYLKGAYGLDVRGIEDDVNEWGDFWDALAKDILGRLPAKTPASSLSESAHCFCGGEGRIQKDLSQTSRWGKGPIVEFCSDAWVCQKCGDTWFNPRMAAARTIALLKATVAALTPAASPPSLEAPAQFVTDSERHRALRIAGNPMAAPITLDTICLLSLALRDAEARAASAESKHGL